VTRFDEIALDIDAELETRRRMRREARIVELSRFVIALLMFAAGIVVALIYSTSRPGPDDGGAPARTEASTPPIDASPPPASVRTMGVRAVPTTREAFVTAKASYYCNADASRGALSRCRIGHPDRPGIDDLYAAAGPAVQRMMGSDWQGERVRVIGNGRDVVVTLIDSCPPCSGIDLYADAFVQLAPLSRGTIEPVLIRPVRAAVPTVPPTDTK
jgi:hypothetical protein